jgi:RNA polymerase sigma factor (sigma-70 family)
MPRVEPTLLAAHIRRIAPAGAEALTDAELVGRYAEHQDAAAFEVLVWRHGPMVWATCRRILRHQHDAEDAFQATFLALARAAPTLGSRPAVAGWLHRVALNAALKLRADRPTMGLTADVPARPEPADGELAGAVDEELDRLPSRSRAAFVLCCLEGMTNAEAARELGCPVGTVDSRLHAARSRLRERLARRGFGPGILAGLVTGAVPAATVSAAACVGAGAVPAPAVAALAAHAGRTMTHGALPMKACIGTVLVLAFAGVVWALGGAGDGPAPKPPSGAAPPVDRAPSDGRIALWREGHPIAFTPGTEGTTALGGGFVDKRGSLRLGPGGTLLVYVENRMTARPAEPGQRDRAYLRDGVRRTEIEVEGVSLCHAFWGADGAVYGYGLALPKNDTDPPVDLAADLVNWSFDPRTGKATRLRLPGNVSVLDITPDGKAFLVLQYEKPQGVTGEYRLGLLPAGGGPLVPLTKLGESLPSDFRLSPDGRRALGRVYREEDGRLVPDLVVLDVADGTRSAVAVPKDARVHASCWSPDGRWIAYAWEPKAAYDERSRERDGPVVPGREKKTRVTVSVARPDGSAAKDVYTETEYWFGSLDWGGSPAEKPPVAPDGKAGAAGPTAWGKAEGGIRLGVSSPGPNRLSVVVENVGPEDIVVNLGMMLANGKRQFPTAVRLTVTDAAGKARAFTRSVGPVAGRVDPFVVPLGSGCGYTLPCRLVDYADAADPGAALAPGTYTVTASFQGERVTQTNGDTAGLALLPYWRGTVRSGAVPLVVPATGLDGTWNWTQVETSGKVHEADGTWAFEGGKVTETVKGRVGGVWAFRADAGASPREIDLIPGEGPAAGKLLRGIYKVETDTLTVCYVSPKASDPDKRNRPTEFDSAKRDDVVVLTLVRRKP